VIARLSIGARGGRVISATIGIVLVIALWWILADTVFASVGVHSVGGGGAVPDPAAVVKSIVTDGIGFYWPNLATTLMEAGIGYLAGNVIALVLTALVMIVPKLDTLVNQIAVLSYCIPLVAIGPILRVVIDPPLPGQPAGTGEFLAAMLVFFTSVVGALLGLRAADRAALDIVTVYGGGRWKQLVKVRIMAAVPSILTSLKIAAPSAFLGAILGEYFGGIDVGLGPAIINAQQSLLIPRAWGIALVAGLVSLLGYLIVGLIGRLVAPWAARAPGGRP
jgi:ABC-type nitrate/sulfonate/bicarbonate transport system permease component